MEIEKHGPLYFVTVNKTATTSITQYMTANKIPFKQWNFRDREKRLLSEEIKSHLHFNFFTVVRNPWDRAISSWAFLTPAHLAPSTTLKQYLLKPFNEMGRFAYKHSVSQFDYIVSEDGTTDYLSHIGRYENLKETIAYINNTFEPSPLANPLPLQHLNKSVRRIDKHYTEFFDDETKELVEKRYAKDIEYFGYKFGE